MNPSAEEPRRSSSRRATPGITTCPACRGPMKSGAKWCPTCNFTGGDSMVIFPDPPPPLLPILDAAGLLQDVDIRKIEAARDLLHRRFPQFQWRICTVSLPRETSLPVFGFWLLNVCPLHANETSDERAWTILLLINAESGQAAVIPGYAAEPYLADDEWRAVLTTMAEPWQAGDPTEAILRFFQQSRLTLDRAWKRYGSRHSSRKSS